MKGFTPALAAWMLLACSADGDGSSPSLDGESLYVIATAVSDDSGANTYVALLDSTDVGTLDLGAAAEFPGWSDLGVIGGWVFVSSGETPEVTRFSVSSERKLVEDGTVNFGNYVSDANFYNQELVSPTKAYVTGEGEFVIWNPTTLEITGTLPFPELPERDGVLPYFALDRGAVVRGDRMYLTVNWSDVQELSVPSDSRIVVVDLKKDEIVDVLSAPCPDLNVADRDELGNLYFSNWVYSPGATLLYDASPACVVRIPEGSEELDDFSLEYADVTGHEGAALGYLGEGKWLFSSFLGDPDQYDPDTDWFDWLFGDSWQLEVLDPNGPSSSVVDGIPKNGGGYYASRFEGVTHVLIPGDGYTTTTVYSLSAEGAATEEIYTEGWATRLYELR